MLCVAQVPSNIKNSSFLMTPVRGDAHLASQGLYLFLTNPNNMNYLIVDVLNGSESWGNYTYSHTTSSSLTGLSDSSWGSLLMQNLYDSPTTGVYSVTSPYYNAQQVGNFDQLKGTAPNMTGRPIQLEIAYGTYPYSSNGIARIYFYNNYTYDAIGLAGDVTTSGTYGWYKVNKNTIAMYLSGFVNTTLFLCFDDNNSGVFAAMRNYDVIYYYGWTPYYYNYSYYDLSGDGALYPPMAYYPTSSVGISFTFGCQYGTFNMLSTKAPTITITAPKTKTKITTHTVTVTGKASAQYSVAQVNYAINASPNWQTATGTTSWSANVNLPKGTNTVWAYSIDTSGNISKVSSVQIICNAAN
jgi:hypothetical protein